MEHLEGRQAVLAALESRNRVIQVVLVAHGSHSEKVQEVIDRATAANVAIKYVDRRELDAMAHSGSHGGVLALATPKPRLSGAKLVEFVETISGPPLMLLLEGIEDARNLGFVIRTAKATFTHAVLIKKHLWDLDSVEIGRPSSGAYERLPLSQIEDVVPLQELQKRGVRLLGCIAGARKTLYDADLTSPTIFAIGGEKRGLSGAVRSICDEFITIPGRGVPSSLSLSHASAIVLAEAMRQRFYTRPRPGKSAQYRDV